MPQNMVSSLNVEEQHYLRAFLICIGFKEEDIEQLILQKYNTPFNTDEATLSACVAEVRRHFFTKGSDGFVADTTKLPVFSAALLVMAVLHSKQQGSSTIVDHLYQILSRYLSIKALRIAIKTMCADYAHLQKPHIEAEAAKCLVLLYDVFRNEPQYVAEIVGEEMVLADYFKTITVVKPAEIPDNPEKLLSSVQNFFWETRRANMATQITPAYIRRKVSTALEELRPDFPIHEEIITEYYFSGRKTGRGMFNEIATALNISADVARNRHRRALERLAKNHHMRELWEKLLPPSQWK
jgi:hypothetical protein